MGILVSSESKLTEFKKGQTLAEYAIIVAAIAIFAYGAYMLVGGSVAALVTSVTAVF